MHQRMQHALTSLIADELAKWRPRPETAMPRHVIAQHVASTFVLVLNWWVERHAARAGGGGRAIPRARSAAAGGVVTPPGRHPAHPFGAPGALPLTSERRGAAFTCLSLHPLQHDQIGFTPDRPACRAMTAPAPTTTGARSCVRAFACWRNTRCGSAGGSRLNAAGRRRREDASSTGPQRWHALSGARRTDRRSAREPALPLRPRSNPCLPAKEN